MEFRAVCLTELMVSEAVSNLSNQYIVTAPTSQGWPIKALSSRGDGDLESLKGLLLERSSLSKSTVK